MRLKKLLLRFLRILIPGSLGRRYDGGRQLVYDRLKLNLISLWQAPVAFLCHSRLNGHLGSALC